MSSKLEQEPTSTHMSTLDRHLLKLLSADTTLNNVRTNSQIVEKNK